MNAKKRFFKVAIEHWPPYFGFRLGTNGQTEGYGAMHQYIEFLAEAMNFNYVLVRPPDGKWGTKMENGSFDGLFGLLERKEANIVLGPSGITSSRYEIADFTHVVSIDKTVLLSPRPKVKSDHFGFVQAFDYKSWAFIFALTIFVSIVFHHLSKYDSILEKSKRVKPIFDSFMWAIGVLSQQGSSPLNTKQRVKYLGIIWIIGTFVLSKAYAGILVAFLTVSVIEEPIDSMEDLVSQDKYTWRMERGVQLYYDFKVVISSPIVKSVKLTRVN